LDDDTDLVAERDKDAEAVERVPEDEDEDDPDEDEDGERERSLPDDPEALLLRPDLDRTAGDRDIDRSRRRWRLSDTERVQDRLRARFWRTGRSPAVDLSNLRGILSPHDFATRFCSLFPRLATRLSSS